MGWALKSMLVMKHDIIIICNFAKNLTVFNLDEQK